MFSMTIVLTLYTPGLFPQFIASNIRGVRTGVRLEQWDPYVKEVFRILKPGIGWAQFIEWTTTRFEGEPPRNSLFHQVLFKLLLSLI